MPYDQEQLGPVGNHEKVTDFLMIKLAKFYSKKCGMYILQKRYCVLLLQVYPFAGLADMVDYSVPRLLINRDEVGSLGARPQDGVMLGDIVKQIELLAAELGWLAELHNLTKSQES